MAIAKKILAIDDNTDILYTLEQICRFQGWTPLLAESYDAAEKILEKNKPDLILVDYHMPGVDGIRAVREIDEGVNRLRGQGTDDTAVFHGRDLFGYTAARLASGIIDFEGVGPAYPVEEIVCHPIPEPTVGPGHARGIFEIDDPNFGNLWTNIPLEAFNAAGFAYGDMVHTRVFHGEELIFEQDVLFHRSFGFAEKGAPMLYNNELMKLGMAVTQGSLERQYGMGFGSDWIVDLSKA